jgi:hypothetical protein
MGFFDQVLHDVGASVAGVFDAPPPAIRAAVESAARALLGETQSAARIRKVAEGSPPVQRLFGVVHRRLMNHPGFQHALSAAQLHGEPLPASHPKAHVIRRGVKDTLHAVDDALPGLLRALNAAKRQAAILHEAGRLHGGAFGGARQVRAVPSHGTRHGLGWRHRHPEPPPRVFWEGPWGWGADYILDEREELGDVLSPDDGEPEWYPGRTWGAGD